MLKLKNDGKGNHQSCEGEVEIEFRGSPNSYSRADIYAYGPDAQAVRKQVIREIDDLIACLTEFKKGTVKAFSAEEAKAKALDNPRPICSAPSVARSER